MCADDPVSLCADDLFAMCADDPLSMCADDQLTQRSGLAVGKPPPAVRPDWTDLGCNSVKDETSNIVKHRQTFCSDPSAIPGVQRFSSKIESRFASMP